MKREELYDIFVKIIRCKIDGNEQGFNELKEQVRINSKIAPKAILFIKQLEYGIEDSLKRAREFARDNVSMYNKFKESTFGHFEGIIRQDMLVGSNPRFEFEKEKERET